MAQFTYPNENAQFIYPVLVGGGGGGSGTFTTEYRTLTSGEATAKQLTLSQTPTAPQIVSVFPVGGPAQSYMNDFSVSGNIVDWNGLGLDAIGLVAGDELLIIYSY